VSWNDKKLQALRDQFQNKHGGEFIDENAQRIADHIFSEEGARQKPWAGLPTFLDAPYKELTADNLQKLQVGIVGMPMDLAVSNRPGSRFGPRAVRAIERVGPYHDGFDSAPLHEMRVADVGDVNFRSRYKLDQSHEDIEQCITQFVENNTMPLSVGGDHSVSHPILKALGKSEPVGMIHIDAHADTGGAFDGERFHHGGPFRNAVLDGVLNPERTIQIGIRGAANYLWEFSKTSGMQVVLAQDMQHMGMDAIIKLARETVGDGPTYLSFDIDSLDPAYAPGTGTPEVGGLTNREAITLLRGLKGINFIGGDMVEVAPQYDATTNTAHNGAAMLFEILGLLQFSPALPK